MALSLAFLVACGGRESLAEPKGPVVKVYIEADGTILIDSKATTLGDLKKALADLKAKDGEVWYSRANPEGDPPPHAMEVIVAIAEARSPIRLMDEPK